MSAKILLVDDDQNGLAAELANLPRDYAIDIAADGAKALALMERQGPYAVVVADVRMAGLGGIEFLTQAQALCPDTARIVLTANADQRTAQDAVNHGHVFRFLTKPCEPEDLALALEEGIHQHELAGTERELLEQTLAGAIQVLTEMLSTADPVSFGRAALAADLAEEVGRRMGLEETWSLRMATLLAPIGMVTLPSALLARHRQGEPLEPRELELFERIPEVGARLIKAIPRMEKVAQFLHYQGKRFDGSGYPSEPILGTAIPIQSRILKAVSDFVACQCQHSASDLAVAQLRAHSGWYDPEVLTVLDGMFPGGATAAANREIHLDELRVGQILAEPMLTVAGGLVLPEGIPLSFSHLAKVQNYSRLMGVREPVAVFEIR